MHDQLDTAVVERHVLVRLVARRIDGLDRVLEELEELGLVARLDLGTGTARFEAVDPGGDRHHHHLLCDDCGLVPFSDADLARVIGRVSQRLPYSISGHDVTLHGSCASCSGDQVRANVNCLLGREAGRLAEPVSKKRPA